MLVRGKILNNQWVMIPSTKMVCEGNSRHALDIVIENRRQQRLKIFTKIGQEEIYKI
jgi:hypothetical protein